MHDCQTCSSKLHIPIFSHIFPEKSARNTGLFIISRNISQNWYNEWQKGLQHVTHIWHEKSGKFICTCHGHLVLSVAVATLISICPCVGSDTIAEDQALLCWPPRWPDIMPCKFFFWGYVNDSVFLLPLP